MAYATFRRRISGLTGESGAMCYTLDRFLGYCGYMPPTTKLALLSVVVAAFLAMTLAARS